MNQDNTNQAERRNPRSDRFEHRIPYRIVPPYNPRRYRIGCRLITIYVIALIILIICLILKLISL